jgi:hypothetical protein
MNGIAYETLDAAKLEAERVAHDRNEVWCVVEYHDTNAARFVIHRYEDGNIFDRIAERDADVLHITGENEDE